MMTTTKKFNFFENPIWNEDGDNCCVCNRPLKKGHGFVEVGIDGYEFGTTDETESQGCWGVGPDCAKKYVEKYILFAEK